jgi:opacity protein-like surface antigen
MFNMTYDFVNDSKYIPFFIGGLGFTDTLAQTIISNKNPFIPQAIPQYYSNNNVNMSWNAGLGMRVKIEKHLFIDLIYRYMRLGSIDWGTLSYPNSTEETDSVSFRAFQVYANTLSLKASMQW